MVGYLERMYAALLHGQLLCLEGYLFAQFLYCFAVVAVLHSEFFELKLNVLVIFYALLQLFDLVGLLP